ncbi:MAG: ligase-associated DNA damage response endonuclease PdeM [Hyphomonadaceae bacterium]|nr:ligase-associated DNA damage response endonuclease PdeM [Hyphomonadaceae bacterium]
MIGATVELQIAGATVTALPGGALWIRDAKTLVVSDLHLEKGSSFALRGQMLPPYDTRATLTKLASLMDRLSPDIVVSLGDSFHDCGGPARMSEGDRALLRDLITRCDWIWVEGNHDGRTPETLGGVVRDMLHLGALALRHEPTGAGCEIAGHLHPCARVSGRGRSVRRRCFAYDGANLVMPAFGAFTGGLNLCDEAFAAIFPRGAMALVLARARVVPVAQERLLPD